MKRLCWILGLMVGCTPQSLEDQAQIDQIVAGVIDAYNRSDLEQLLGYFDAEADLQPPASEPYHGMESIRNRYSRFFEAYVVSLSISPGKTHLSGKLAVHTGTVTGTLISRTDSTVTALNNQFAMVLKKKENQWKIHQLLWNSKSPDN